MTSWHELRRGHRGTPPQPQEELSIYESLFALWPPQLGRPGRGHGGAREGGTWSRRPAKRSSTPRGPIRTTAYEDVVTSFVDALTARPDFREFDDPLQRGHVQRRPLSNVLGLVVLKSWAPGVPDFYQGTELIEPTLTDPDNRRAGRLRSACRLPGVAARAVTRGGRRVAVGLARRAAQALRDAGRCSRSAVASPSSSRRAPTSRWRSRPATPSPSSVGGRTEASWPSCPASTYRLAGPGRHRDRRRGVGRGWGCPARRGAAPVPGRAHAAGC